MFRTHPPRFALASVAIWSALCLLTLVIVWRCWSQSTPSLRYLSIIEIALTVSLGALLWMHLPRALQWQPRRSVRPSPELQAERKRIARDLHDHVGSQLVGAMALLDAAVPAQAQALRALEQCLLDLRLVVDSMDGNDESLPERLARLRHRMQPVLERQGIQVVWDVDCTGDAMPPVGERAAHLACIAQEALSNVLQHSGATQVQVRMVHVPDRGHWQLDISDNGTGLPTELAWSSWGRGLTGMQERAKLARGRLHLLRPQRGGTCVRIVLPCADSASPGHSP